VQIAILTTGRFHVCDLARELDSLGHDVFFYSCLPAWRTEQFGLPRHCSRTLWLCLPLFLLSRRLGNTRLRAIAELLLVSVLDYVASHVVRECDVFIGMSGMSQRTARAVRQKYGAQVWIERGSRHILSQKRILDDLQARGAGIQSVSDTAVERELADYAEADVVVVPSRDAEESFVEHGYPVGRIFRNPYGVDLSMFPATPAPLHDPRTIIMVGTWSLRKGCDLLVEAWRRIPNVRLLHVGAVSDAPLPSDRGFEHVDPVPQAELKDWYARAHVCVLASREEGLAVVQAQALACGVQLVCTDRTGGEDLKQYLNNPAAVAVVPHDEVVPLAEAIISSLKQLPEPGQPRDLLGATREKLSWREYGKRYHRELLRRVEKQAAVNR
jgi:alpha-maltose-1-phosphate synthase